MNFDFNNRTTPRFYAHVPSCGGGPLLVTPGLTTVTRGDLIGLVRVSVCGIFFALLILNGVGHATGHDDLPLPTTRLSVV